MSDADRGISGGDYGIVRAVREGPVLGDAERVDEPIARVGAPDQAPDQVDHERALDEIRLELRARPAAAGDHRALQPRHLHASHLTNALLQELEPGLRGVGERPIVLGARLGERTEARARLVLHDGLEGLVEAHDELAGAVVERQGAGGIEIEVGTSRSASSSGVSASDFASSAMRG